MNHRVLGAACFSVVLTLLLTPVARAVDGTIEINQAKVLAAGGFPYTISTAGSYRLTGNLTVAGTVSAIKITVPNVTIDLNGFSIVGPGAGISSGIAVFAISGVVSQNQIEVKNGTMTGFASGVNVGDNSIVKNIRAVANNFGIEVGSNTVVDGCTASSSVNDGIDCMGSGCTISGNTASKNSSNGIQCIGSGCAISGNTASNNNIDGIFCKLSQCVISGNTANNNVGDGIDIGNSGTNGSLVVRNFAGGNGSFGLDGSQAATGYGENVFQGNNGMGAQVNSGTSLGAGNTNLCNGVKC